MKHRLITTGMGHKYILSYIELKNIQLPFRYKFQVKLTNS